MVYQIQRSVRTKHSISVNGLLLYKISSVIFYCTAHRKLHLAEDGRKGEGQELWHKKKRCQCKGKDRKEMLLVAAVDLLEVVVSYPMLATLVVRRVIVNEYPLRRQQTLLAGEGQQGSQIGSVS